LKKDAGHAVTKQHVHDHKTGENVTQTTEYVLEDYRHTCRTCKDMESFTTVKKSSKYKRGDLLKMPAISKKE
jgi:hypothetical protein